MKIRILSIDIDKSEGSDTIIDKSKGVKNYTLYIFKSNALAKTSVGLTDVHAGDILFLGPDFPHYIRSKQGEWAYDAISFKGSDATRLVSQVGIELKQFERSKQFGVRQRSKTKEGQEGRTQKGQGATVRPAPVVKSRERSSSSSRSGRRWSRRRSLEAEPKSLYLDRHP